MPIEIDGLSDGLLVIRSRGALVFPELAPLYRVLKGILSPGPGYVLWYHEAGCHYACGKEELMRMRLAFAVALERQGEGAIACVCPDLCAYGIVRQLQSLCRSGVGIGVFRDPAAAEAWIMECREEAVPFAMAGWSPPGGIGT